jgi:PAS domain S-box-containing protein
MDDRAEITLWNRGAERIYGYREHEILGVPFKALLTEQAGLDLLGESPAIGNTLELEGVRKDGTRFPLELSLAAGTRSDGTFITAVIRDISDRGRAAAMRAPLEIIVASADLLIENQASPKEDAELLRQIRRRAAGVLALLDQMSHSPDAQDLNRCA